MPVKAVIFDAYGTLLRNEDMLRIPRRIVADHALSAPVHDVFDAWIDLYSEAIQQPTFRTLRAIQGEVLRQLLRRFEVDGDASRYVERITSTWRPGTSPCPSSSSSSPKRYAPTSRIPSSSAARSTDWDFTRTTCCTSATASWTTSPGPRPPACASHGSTAVGARAVRTHRRRTSRSVICAS